MIRFDESHRPLLAVHFEGRVSDEQFLDYLERLNEVLAAGQRYAIVLDATRAQVTPLSQQRMQANWMRSHRDALMELNVGTALVYSSSVFRLIVTGVFMLQPPPMPYTVCGTLEEGVEWAAGKLGITARPSTLSFESDEDTSPGRRL